MNIFKSWATSHDDFGLPDGNDEDIPLEEFVEPNKKDTGKQKKRSTKNTVSLGNVPDNKDHWWFDPRSWIKRNNNTSNDYPDSFYNNVAPGMSKEDLDSRVSHGRGSGKPNKEDVRSRRYFSTKDDLKY